MVACGLRDPVGGRLGPSLPGGRSIGGRFGRSQIERWRLRPCSRGRMRRSPCVAGAHPLLHERRRKHDREADHEKHDGERLHPIRQADALGQNLHDLESNPASTEIDPQNLPEGSPVRLVNELLESRHRAVPAGGHSLRPHYHQEPVEIGLQLAVMRSIRASRTAAGDRGAPRGWRRRVKADPARSLPWIRSVTSAMHFASRRSSRPDPSVRPARIRSDQGNLQK